MKCTPFGSLMAVAIIFGLSLGEVRADGGIIRLREAKGSFVVTIFTASEPVKDEPIDVSVMVQRSDSGDVVLDAGVELRVISPDDLATTPGDQLCGPMGAMSMVPSLTTFRATRGQASNKLLYAVPVRLGAVGVWKLQVSVEEGTDTAIFVCNVPVEPPLRRLAGLAPYLAVPPVMVMLFAVNQRLRRRTLVAE